VTRTLDGWSSSSCWLGMFFVVSVLFFLCVCGKLDALAQRGMGDVRFAFSDRAKTFCTRVE
jgi:hypothetical protein